MGLVSEFGNDVDTYYNKLLAGESGIGPIDRFDASKFPTSFGGQIHVFSSEGYIDGKNDRRLDDCLRYCIVAGKKALEDADLGGEKLTKLLPHGESIPHERGWWHKNRYGKLKAVVARAGVDVGVKVLVNMSAKVRHMQR